MHCSAASTLGRRGPDALTRGYMVHLRSKAGKRADLVQRGWRTSERGRGCLGSLALAIPLRIEGRTTALGLRGLHNTLPPRPPDNMYLGALWLRKWSCAQTMHAHGRRWEGSCSFSGSRVESGIRRSRLNSVDDSRLHLFRRGTSMLVTHSSFPHPSRRFDMLRCSMSRL